jgi:CheY-like chemotaxis protein
MSLGNTGSWSIRMGSVLVVDDHEDIRRMLGRLIRACGHDASIAADGEEAIMLATENPPGLIVLDLMMPGVTGFDVMRSLRSDPRTREVPIVVFSALNDPEFVEQALGVGANDYWVKGTFDFGTLDKWLKYYLADGKR